MFENHGLDLFEGGIRWPNTPGLCIYVILLYYDFRDLAWVALAR